jgi:hypothetical protein
MKPSVLGKWVMVEEFLGKAMVKDGDEVVLGQLIAKQTNKREVVDSNFSNVHWKQEEKSAWLAMWTGKEVEGGEVLRKESGLFGGKSWLARERGKIVGIDDFGNLVYEIEGDEMEVVSPVNGTIRLQDKGRLWIEFRADKIEGQGLGVGKAWGTIESCGVVGKLTDVSSNLEGMIVLVSRLEEGLVIKAEVSGVAGVITKAIKGELETELPVLVVNEGDWGSLVTKLARGKTYRCLLNASLGRMLMVESKRK